MPRLCQPLELLRVCARSTIFLFDLAVLFCPYLHNRLRSVDDVEICARVQVSVRLAFHQPAQRIYPPFLLPVCRLWLSCDTLSHVFGQTGKKEYGYENVKVSNSAWDTNLISASAVGHLFYNDAHTS